jgi:hypothetical protein
VPNRYYSNNEECSPYYSSFVPNRKHKILTQITAARSSSTCPVDLDSIAPTSNIYNQLINNASYLFAWQLTAVAPSVPFLSEISTACSDYSPLAARIMKIGLNADVLKIGLCQRQGCGIDTDKENIVRHIESYFQKITALQFLNAWVDAEEALPVLCDGFDAGRVGSMLFGSDDLIQVTCNAAGRSTPNDTSAASLSSQNLTVIKSATSQIFAWDLLATISDISIVQKACNEDNAAFRDAVNKTMLMPDAVESVMCQYTLVVPTPALTTLEIEKLSAYAFVRILWNAGTSSAYREFICAGSQEGELSNISGYGLLNVGIDWQSAERELLTLCTG